MGRRRNNQSAGGGCGCLILIVVGVYGLGQLSCGNAPHLAPGPPPVPSAAPAPLIVPATPEAASGVADSAGLQPPEVGGGAEGSAWNADFDPDKVTTPPIYARPDPAREAYPVIFAETGDAVVLKFPDGTVRMHLGGVHAPDAGESLGSKERFCREATAYLDGLLAGQKVNIERDPAFPIYSGRSAAYLYRVKDGLFINHEMVRLGYARADDDQHKPYRFRLAFLAAQEEVREGRHGLWAFTDTRGNLPRVGAGAENETLARAGREIRESRELQAARRSTALLQSYEATASPAYAYDLGVHDIPRRHADQTVHVNSYHRKDGTSVRGHWRRPPRR